MTRTLRIANASGYWGDDPETLTRQVRGGPVDYVTLDFLAEITMVILQRQRARDPALGYAYDFVRMLAPLLGEIEARGVRIVANAGGINVSACADRIAEQAVAQGVGTRLGVVSGDDLMPRLDAIVGAGVPLANLDDGRPFADVRADVVAANAYLGAWPISEALAGGAAVVVTGRTTDAALTLGPLVHEFGWAWDDFDRLAAGTVAGHVIECGAQATGGNLTDWVSVPMRDVGYPIAEAAMDGSFVLTKHAGTGGRVSRATVVEQLLYEIGDPAGYLTPDVTVDMRGLDVRAVGADRVQVTGARGTPPPDQLKVTIVHRAGWRAVGTALLSGPDIRRKAERLAGMILDRVGSGVGETRVDLVGDRSCWGDAAPDREPNEGVLRVAVRDDDRARVERFAQAMMGFALQGPPGIGIFGGRPDVQPAYGYWPTLVPRDLVTSRLEVREADGRVIDRRDVPVPAVPTRPMSEQPRSEPTAGGRGPAAAGERVPLRRIAYARSGDKGAHANVGVAARSKAAEAWLRATLTPDVVARYFGDRVRGGVERFEVPGLGAFNFLLRDALGGGGTLSLRTDHQGKTLGQALLGLEIPVPADVLGATPADGEGGT
jgi:hypothetical protein